MKGEGKIKRTNKNGTEIELSISKMPRPFELGAGYATYILWAISPDGQVDNLGEIKRRGFFEFDSKISVTTPLQTFALIVTAEPHFLVRRPSQAIGAKMSILIAAAVRVWQRRRRYSILEIRVIISAMRERRKLPRLIIQRDLRPFYRQNRRLRWRNLPERRETRRTN